MSTPEESYNPQPLDLPDCWVASKPIGPIVITYDGPSLVGSTIALSFTGGLTEQVASFEEDFSEDYPNRHIITFEAFAPGEPSTSDNVVKYKMMITLADAREVLLFYGTWKLRVLEL